MAKKLKVNVNVDGTLYGPDGEQDVPKDVAEQIGDHAWEDVDEESGLLKGQTSPDSYDGVSAATLKAEIKRRNADRDDEDKIPESGNRDKLAEALLVDDGLHTPA